MSAPRQAGSGRSTAYSKCVFRHITCLLLPFWQCAHAALEMPDEAPGAAAYIDQLIDLTTGQEDIDPVYREHVEQPQGRRYLDVRLHHFSEDRSGQGASYENGLLVNWRRETRNYGEFEAEGALLGVRADPGRNEQASTGTLLTLRQHDFAINNNWLMQNSIGIDRTWFDPVLASSYRFKLPSTLLVGANTHLSSSAGDFRFTAGHLGQLDSGQVHTFEATSGRLLSAGFSKAPTENLHTGIQLVHVDGASNVADHSSVAGVLEYRDSSHARRYQLHALADTGGAAGFWLDGDLLHGHWRHRFGAFRLGPGLLWTDTVMANDMQGFYARADMQTLRYQLSGGLDYNSGNLDDDPLQNGTRNITAFITGNRQLNRLTGIGGTLNLRDSRSTNSAVAGGSRIIRLTGHASHRFKAGTTRLQLQLADIENGSNHGSGSGFTWDQSWELKRDLLVSSSVGYEVENGAGNDESRLTTGLLAHYEYSSRLRWDVNVNWIRTNNDSSGIKTNAVNANAAVLWRFLPGWEASLRAGFNDASDASSGALAGTDFAGTERIVFLSVRREIASGRPFERLGTNTGKTGYGNVEGVVFFDENRDGVRQAGEKAAAGVYVYLDRNYQKVTERDGRFVFAPVTAGEHQVSIAVEDLPLPWGLDDESPRTLTVNVRERTSLAIPLVRFDE